MEVVILFFFLFLIYIFVTIIETNKVVKNNSEKLDKIIKLLEKDTDKNGM